MSMCVIVVCFKEQELHLQMTYKENLLAHLRVQDKTRHGYEVSTSGLSISVFLCAGFILSLFS